MKLTNQCLGDFTVKDMLKDILDQAEMKGEYKKDRNKMIEKINSYLGLLK